VRSAIGLAGAIIAATVAAVIGYVKFDQRATELSGQVVELSAQLKAANFWTVSDMTAYGHESRVLNWSLVRKDEPNVPSGLLTPDARQIHKDNQL